jgi:hypothetical protein
MPKHKMALPFCALKTLAGFVSPPKAGKQTFAPRLLEKRYIATTCIKTTQTIKRR